MPCVPFAPFDSFRMIHQRYDAIVVGSGPNGLAAAITLAQMGHSVLVIEARSTIGGGLRSSPLTLPGFTHDVCSAIHPLAIASPFFRSIDLKPHGLEWIQPEIPLAHPLDDGTAALLHRSVADTAKHLRADGPAYRQLLEPIVCNMDTLLEDVLAPPRVPRHLAVTARFGLRAIQSANGLAKRKFGHEPARALWAGLAAHGVLPLESTLSSAAGLLLGAAGHAYGWPLPRGGAQQVANALADYLRSLGGEVATDRPVESLRELPAVRVVLLDVTPSQLDQIAGDVLPEHYRRKLLRFRHGPGVFKVDWALSAPVPWRATDCARAATVHVGGTLDEVASAERAAFHGETNHRPFVLVVQPSLFDPSRAPQGQHILWAYCHVPHGSTADMTEQIEAQIERFAPGFRGLVLARHTMAPADFNRYNANYVGGDITGGIMDLRQVLARPVLSRCPYAVPAANLFLCSSSTPPGPGVHGMCGYHAARAAMRVLRK